MKNYTFEIKETYIDKSSKEHKIRNIEFDKENYYFGEKIKVQEQHKPISDYLENGSFIFKSKENPKRAFKIYEDFKINLSGSFSDLKLVSNLKSLQDKVSLTEFPTGIITMDHKIIGQEIPYYEDYISIARYIENNKLTKDDLIKVINIFQELLKNNIHYNDTHTKNLLINPETRDIKLIDFESQCITIGEYESTKRYNKFQIIYLLRELIQKSTIDVTFEDMYDYDTNINKILKAKENTKKLTLTKKELSK